MEKEPLFVRSPEGTQLIETALSCLKGGRARYGLPRPITCFKRASNECVINNQRVDYWITINDRKIPLRVEPFRSRPRRQQLKKLIAGHQIPTLVIYEYVTTPVLLRKIAQCIKLGIDRVRRENNIYVWKERVGTLPQMTLPNFHTPLIRSAYRTNNRSGAKPKRPAMMRPAYELAIE